VGTRAGDVGGDGTGCAAAPAEDATASAALAPAGCDCSRSTPGDCAEAATGAAGDEAGVQCTGVPAPLLTDPRRSPTAARTGIESACCKAGMLIPPAAVAAADCIESGRDGEALAWPVRLVRDATDGSDGIDTSDDDALSDGPDLTDLRGAGVLVPLLLTLLATVVPPGTSPLTYTGRALSTIANLNGGMSGGGMLHPSHAAVCSGASSSSSSSSESESESELLQSPPAPSHAASPSSPGHRCSEVGSTGRYEVAAAAAPGATCFPAFLALASGVCCALVCGTAVPLPARTSPLLPMLCTAFDEAPDGGRERVVSGVDMAFSPE